MANNFEELYDELKSDYRFNNSFTTKKDFEDYLAKSPDANEDMKIHYGVEDATSYLKKKEESDSLSNLQLAGNEPTPEVGVPQDNQVVSPEGAEAQGISMAGVYSDVMPEVPMYGKSFQSNIAPPIKAPAVNPKDKEMVDLYSQKLNQYKSEIDKGSFRALQDFQRLGVDPKYKELKDKGYFNNQIKEISDSFGKNIYTKSKGLFDKVDVQKSLKESGIVITSATGFTPESLKVQPKVPSILKATTLPKDERAKVFSSYSEFQNTPVKTPEEEQIANQKLDGELSKDAKNLITDGVWIQPTANNPNPGGFLFTNDDGIVEVNPLKVADQVEKFVRSSMSGVPEEIKPAVTRRLTRLVEQESENRLISEGQKKVFDAKLAKEGKSVFDYTKIPQEFESEVRNLANYGFTSLQDLQNSSVENITNQLSNFTNQKQIELDGFANEIKSRQEKGEYMSEEEALADAEIYARMVSQATSEGVELRNKLVSTAEQNFKLKKSEVEKTKNLELQKLYAKYDATVKDGKISFAAMEKLTQMQKDAYTEFMDGRENQRRTNQSLANRISDSDFKVGALLEWSGDRIQAASARTFDNAIEALNATVGYENNPLTGMLKYMKFVEVNNKKSNLTFAGANGFAESTEAALSSILDQTPNLALGISVGVLTQNPYIGGMISWAQDTADQVGQNYKDKFAETGSEIEARNSAKVTLQVQSAMLPLYAVQFAPFVSGVLKTARGISAKAVIQDVITLAGVEYAPELATELVQNYTAAKLNNDPKYKNATFIEYAKAEGPTLALEILPSVAVMSGAGVVSSRYESVQREKRLASFKEFTGQRGLDQMIASAIDVVGPNAATAIPEYLLQTGQITMEEFQTVKQGVVDIAATYPGAKSVIKDDNKSKYYVDLMGQQKELESSLEQIPEGNVLREFIQNKIEGIKTTMKDLVSGKDVDFVVFENKGGFKYVTDKQKAAQIIETNKEAIETGLIKVNTKDTDINATVQEMTKDTASKKGSKQVKFYDTGDNLNAATADNQYDLNQLMASSTRNQVEVDNIVQQTKNAQKVLDKLLPGVRIFLHTNDSYMAKMAEIGGSDRSIGNQTSVRYSDGTYGAEIQVNLDTAKDTTVAHEVTHAILLKVFGQDVELFADFKNSLSALVSDSDNKVLTDFVNKYKQVEQGEEYLVQLTAMMAAQGTKLDPTLLQKIATLINKFVSTVTFGTITPFKNTADVVEVSDFFNALSDSIKSGQVNKKLETNAVQKQSTNEVSVQPEARVGEEVVEGKPQAKPQVTPKEGQKEEVSGVPQPTETKIENAQVQVVNENNGEREVGDILLSGYVNPEEIKNKSELAKVFQPVDISWEVDPNSGITLQVPEERKSMYDVVSTSGGAILVANSDGTGIGKVVDGQILQGGIGYSFINQNIADNVGFAASDDAKIPSIWESAQEAARLRDAQNPEMAGNPVAVFVMVQAPAATFGNAYAATYFGNVLKAISKDRNYETTKAKNELVEFINDFRTNNEYGRKYNDAFAELISIIRNTDFTKPQSIDKITNILITEKKRGLPAGTSQAIISENNKRFGFDARRAFFEKFFVGTGKANSSQPANQLRNYLKEKGFGQESFYGKYVDQNIMNNLQGETPGKRLEDSGFTMTGFFVDPNLEKQDFIDKSKKGTYQHKQFNSKFYGSDAFVLNGKYYVNEMFPEARFVASDKKGGAEIPVQASAALSLYPRTRKGQVSDIIERAKKIDETINKSQKVRSEESSGTTQVATTIGSYKKAANLIKNIQGDVLDYGAGLGLGTDAMSNTLGRKVDSYEPNPERWKGKEEATYTASDQINKKYDGIVSLNVLNVVPKDIRDAIVTDIFEKLNVDGKAVISTRKWSGDVNGAKNAIPGAEEKSLIITRKQKGENVEVFQKGFDGNELVDYVQSLLGDKANVTKDNSFGAAGVIITKKAEITNKSQLNPTDISPAFQSDIMSGLTEAEALKNIVKEGYLLGDIKDQLGLPYVDEAKYKEAHAALALESIEKLNNSKKDTAVEIENLINANYMMPMADQVAGLLSQGFSHYEIFRTMYNMDIGTAQEYQDAFGVDYRQTIKNAIESENFSDDYLEELTTDTRTIKKKKVAEDLYETWQRAGMDFVDAVSMVEAYADAFEEKGMAEAAVAMRKELEGVTTQEGLRDGLVTFSALLSNAGFMLQLGRNLFPKKMGDMIAKSLERDGIQLTPKQKENLERLVSELNTSKDNLDAAADKFMDSFSDEDYAEAKKVEKQVKNAAREMMNFLDNFKPKFWNDRLTSGGSRALLGIQTVGLSVLANVENAMFNQNIIVAATRKAYDAGLGGVKSDTFSIRNWWNAATLSRDKTLGEMAEMLQYGFQSDPNYIEKFYDGLAQINFFKDTHLGYKMMGSILGKINGKKLWQMTDEEYADAFNQVIYKTKDGSLELADGKTYKLLTSLFWGWTLAPQATEITGRLMALGGDKAFANAYTTRAMIDYFKNTATSGATGGFIEDYMADRDLALDRNTLKKLLSVVDYGLEADNPFEQEGLKKVFLGDNFLSKGLSAVRGKIRKNIKANYKTIKTSNEIEFGKRATLGALQSADVLVWSVAPFAKVPANVIYVATQKSFPPAALAIYYGSQRTYDKKQKEFDKRYPKAVKKFASDSQKKAYEEAKMELTKLKRQVTYDFAQIEVSFGVAAFALSAVLAGAIIASSEPGDDKDKLYPAANLRAGNYNRTLHEEYLKALLSGKPLDNFAIRRGGAVLKGDKINAFNNMGISGYALGAYSSAYRAYNEEMTTTGSKLKGISYGMGGLLFGELLTSGAKQLPMMQGFSRIYSAFTDEKGAKFTNWASGTAAASLSVFSPSILSVISKGNAESIQSLSQLHPEYEPSMNEGVYGLMPRTIGKIFANVVQKLNRNVSFLAKNQYYEAAIGPFGEDMQYRTTTSEPGTAMAYLETMINPFASRTYKGGFTLTPTQVEKQKELYRRSMSIHITMVNLALAYTEMTGSEFIYEFEGEKMDLMSLIADQKKNEFVFSTGDTRKQQGMNEIRQKYSATYSLPMETYREELKKRGELKFYAMQDVDNAVEKGVIGTTQSYIRDGNLFMAQQTIENFFNLYAKARTAANVNYEKDFKNRQRNILEQMKQKGLINKEDYEKLTDIGGK